MARIVIVDDEADLVTMVKLALEKDGHTVSGYQDATKIREVALMEADLIILDVMMPNVDGMTYCQSIRHQVDCPILFLTAKSTEEDMLEGFASGGDDYMKKPFSLKELRARVTVHLRREKREKQYRLMDDEISLDIIGKKVYVHEELVYLTQAEFKICELLLKNKGQAFSKEDIYEHLYGFDGEGDSQTIVTERVKNIRNKFKKLGINPIGTVWGLGYKWEKQV